ncbi:MAG: hypothetical protein QI223_05150, partial [Candidatus Korarchaeota archaeon]|nr:hypothetical protein [Candidatus Korarchaeota archaeon]
DRAKQVIILSHNPWFLWSVWQDAPGGQRKALCIRRMRDQSVIQEWNMDEELRSPYEEHYVQLQRYLDEGATSGGELLNVAKCIRPLLEAYLRVRCPTKFTARQSLGDMIQRIREERRTQPDLLTDIDLQELEELNEYSRGFHHGGGRTGPVDDAELRAYAERALALVQGLRSSR